MAFRRNNGHFRKNDPRINRRGRRKGSKNKKVEYAYACPYCRGPLGPVRERRLTKLTEEQVKAIGRQMVRRSKHRVPRLGRWKCEKGPDPARNPSGRARYA